jgi:Domain of unknown function (DUF4330)
MPFLDRQGRLFGKISILDIGAALVIVASILGIFLIPTGNSSGSVAGGSKTEVAEIDVAVRGLNVRNQDKLREDFQPGKKLSFVIRNQPTSPVEIKSIRSLDRLVTANQPDGSVKAVKDPRPDSFSMDMIVTVKGQGQSTEGGFTIGGTKVKIGSSVEVDQKNYNFMASVIDVRYGETLKSPTATDGTPAVKTSPASASPPTVPSASPKTN